jgi:hypothetical protein
VHVNAQRLVSVVKMATMLEGVLPKNSVLLCVYFLWAQVVNAKDILFTVGSFCRVKPFTIG